MSPSSTTKQEVKKHRQHLYGVVDRAKAEKTRRVKIEFLVKHPKYGKYIRRRTLVSVHDEENVSQAGDRVEIIPCRPMSKTKRWKVVRVMEKAAS